MANKKRLRYRLRTLLFAMVFIAIAIVFWQRVTSQRDNVQSLLAYEYYFPDPLGDRFPEELRSNTTWVDVLYRDQVTWNKKEQKFVRDLPNRDNQFYCWLRGFLGRDWVTYPVAVEISCNDYDLENGKIVSTFNESLVNNIKRLPTIKQIWIIETVRNGEPVNAFSSTDIKERFPNLVLAPAHLEE